jgi:hypothetical protein
MFRVLRPGGRVAVSVWAAIEECPSMAAIERALRDELGDDPADRYRSGPWGMPDGASLATLMEAGGFARARVVKHALPAVFPGGAHQLSRSLAASGVAGEIAGLSAEGRAALDERIAHHLRALTVDDRVEAVLHSNIATAEKP